MRIRLTFLFCLLCLTASAQFSRTLAFRGAAVPRPSGIDTTQWFVANAGSDANTGHTLGAALQHFTNALSKSVSGDTVFLNSGDTFTETNIFVSKPTKIKTTSSGRAIVTSLRTNESIINVTNCSNVLISNLTLVGFGPRQGTTNGHAQIGAFDNQWGVKVLNSVTNTTNSSITIAQCDVSNVFGGIVALCSSNNNGIANFAAISNSVHDLQWDGIITWNLLDAGTIYNFISPLFFGNTVSNCLGWDKSTAGIGIAIGMATNCLVETNLVANCGAEASNGGGGPGGVVAVFTFGGAIRHNEAFGMFATEGGVDGIGIDADISSFQTMIEGNYVHDNEGAGLLDFQPAGNNTFRWNLSVNNGYGFYETGSGGLGDYIYNNTFLTRISTGNGIRIDGDTTTTNIVANNIIGTSGGNTFYLPNGNTGLPVDFSGNNYWGLNGSTAVWVYNANTYNSLGAFRAGTGQETATGTTNNPLIHQSLLSAYCNAQFLNLSNYLPEASSPLLAGGVNIATAFAQIPSIGSSDAAGLSPVASSVGGYSHAYVFDNSTYLAMAYSNAPMISLDFGRGTFVDSVTRQTLATVALGTVYATNSIANSIPAAFWNDGAINISNVWNIQGYNALSVEFVLQQSSIGSVLGSWGADGPHQNLLFQTDASDVTMAIFDTSSSPSKYFIATSPASLLGVTNHVVLTWAGGNNFNYWLNGTNESLTVVESDSPPFIRQSADPFRIGENIDASGTQWQGKIGPILIYNYVLSDNAITNHYKKVWP